MTHLLITGAAGFIGSHAIEHVQANTDWEITGLASFRHRGDSIRTLAFDERTRILHADLTAPLSPRLARVIGPVDLIWNIAAESSVDRSISEPRPFIENNVELAITMLDYARQVEPRAFLQISTDEVYGPAPAGYAHREWDAPIPSNPYSASKAAQEAVAISYWRTYDVPVVITNTMNNIGERQDPEKFVPMCIRRILRGEPVTIHGTANQIGSRYYMHARNHADALLYLSDQPVARYPDTDRPDRWNVVGEEELTNLDMAQLIADILGKPLLYELIDFHSARPGHDARYALDGTKLATAGWKAPISLRDSLARMIDWTLAHPEWLEGA